MSALSHTERLSITVLAAAIAVVTATVSFWLFSSGALLAKGGADSVIALGRLSGLALMLLVLAQLLFASRAPFLDLFDHFSPFGAHRVTGFSILGVILLHAGFLSFGYAARGGISAWAQFFSFITSWKDVGAAFAGVLIIITIGMLSARFSKRRFRYELWYLAHLSLYAAILLTIGHQIASGDMADGAARVLWTALIVFVFAIFLLYRALRPAWFFFRCRFRVSRVVPESLSAVSIYITGRHMDAFRFKAGQYAHFTFLQKGMTAHHPFSFSNPYNGREIRITVKALGDFSGSAMHLRPGTRVVIDGPMGHLTRRVAVGNWFCFISGGVGITPLLALAKSLPNPRDAMAFVSNHSSADAPLVAELAQTGIMLKNYFPGEPSHKRITAEEILRACPDVRERDVYICGPAGMMQSLAESLIEQGVPRGQIHTEKFAY